VYAYTAARLAAHTIAYHQVGGISTIPIQMIPFQKASLTKGTLKGNIAILDIQYGNIWTNIDQQYWKEFNTIAHTQNKITLEIYHVNQLVYSGTMPFENTFGAVAVGKPLAYLNSLMNVSFALNQGSMADKFHIAAGADWNVAIRWAK
jgi:S-adenosylmethionine hydrolase